MVASKPEVFILQVLNVKYRNTHTFLGSGSLMRLLKMPRDLTSSVKSKMAATRCEVMISQFVELATKFRRLHQCFKGPAFKWD